MANYFKSLNESFDRMFTFDKTIKRTRKLKEDVGAINPWFDLDVEDQIAAIQSFVKNYKGKRVFEDFADSVGVDAEDVIDLFADMESRRFVKIPQRMQIDSQYASDELYESKRCKLKEARKPIKEDGAEDFLNELSDAIRKDVWDVVFDDVAEAIEDFDNLPDYLPMTEEEANNDFVNAVRKLAEAAFIKYCVDNRGDDYDFDECLKEDKKPSQDNAIDRYQRWVDFDMAHYGKISKRTQDFVNKAGYQILKDDHGDYEVAAGHFE